MIYSPAVFCVWFGCVCLCGVRRYRIDRWS